MRHTVHVPIVPFLTRVASPVREANLIRRRIAGVLGAVAVAALLGARASGYAQAEQVWTIDSDRSRVTIEVGRTGLLGFVGHNHEVIAPSVSGKIVVVPGDPLRSSVVLRFDASALQVTGKGDPPADIPEVERVMQGDRVLDVKRFPAVLFQSRRVVATLSPPAIDVVVEGDLTLRGVTRPITVRATASLADGAVVAQGSFAFKQTDFGMEPVTAVGGTVRVKDELSIQFVFRAVRGN
jgi:polyisoprenoid-binding protein YceI